MNNTYIKTGSGQNIYELRDRIIMPETALVLLFYGEDANEEMIYKTMQKSGTNFLGCMDAGRFTDNQYRLDPASVTAMSFSGELFDAMAFRSVDMSAGRSYSQIRSESRQALQEAAAEISINLASPDMSREFIINLVYGLSSATPFLEGQGEAGILMQSIGGSSGGKLDFRNSGVISHLGKGACAAFGLFRLKKPFSYIMDRVSSFQSMPGKTLVATKLSAPRHILEFNRRPAAAEYCRVLGIEKATLSPAVFAVYTLGIEPGDNERLITSIMDVDKEHHGLYTYNDVVAGTAFNLYQTAAQAADRQRVYTKLMEKDLVAFISFDCILCYLARNTEAKRAELSGVYGKTLAGIPKIGFATFSENICGANINQTETFLALTRR